MRRLAFLLRPGWLALFVVVIAFAYLCFTVLAPWQLGKNTKTSRENDQISHSLTADPVPLTTFLPQQDSSAPDAQWRRVTATGHYLPDAQVVARLRVVEGDPAFEVLVPFAVDGGPTVLVDRGYVRPVQGSQVPTIAAAADRTGDDHRAAARLRTGRAGQGAVRQDGVQQVYSISTAQIAAVMGVPLAGSYLQLVEDQPGGLGVIALPHLDAGPFLSYGIQWIAFGIIAPIGLGYFVYAEIRQRRRERPPRRRGRRPAHDRGEARRPLRPAALSADRDDRGCGLHRSRQPHRAAQIRDLGRPAVAERGPDLEFVCVLRRPAEPHAKRSGEGRLHHAGVRAGVAARVAAPRAQRLAQAIRRPAARTPPPAAPSRGPRRSWRHRPIVLQPNRIGHSAASGGRSSRPGC